MRRAAPGILAVLLAVAPVAAQPPQVRTIAVADFENISVDSGLIPTSALSDLLARLLQRQGTTARVVAGAPVREAMRARGWSPADLVSPSRAAEIARAVGADWIVTGRWTQLRLISRSTIEDPVTGLRGGDGLAIASVQVQVLDVSTRRRLFEGRFDGQGISADLGSLYTAAAQALQGAAAAIARL